MALTKSTKDVSIHSRALCTVTEVWNTLQLASAEQWHKAISQTALHQTCVNYTCVHSSH